MQLTTTKITELSLDRSNVRKHSRRNLDAIKASLRKFGQQKPIVVDAKGIVLAGNGTLTAAQELGWTEIQIVRTELAGVEATAFAIADNRTAELAEWEEDKLSQVLQSLKVEDADLLAATGYDAAEVDKMSKAEVTEDEVPEPPAEPITKAGDLWILGEHRVLCGDSTKAEDVERLTGGEKAGAVVTDPPYGIGIASNPIRQAHAKSTWDDAVPSAEVIAMCATAAPVAIIWGGNYFNLPPTQCLLVWDKKQPEDFSLAMCEVAWTNLKHPAKMHRQSVTSYAKEHPTQKPVELMAWCVGKTEGIVLDPFLGSGTTLIAAEQLGRKCYGMEISPAYCDVIVKRWQNLTGKKAVLDKPTT
jgi:site-specific DNA-methyltransferase (adenine-specific)/modification methylase